MAHGPVFKGARESIDEQSVAQLDMAITQLIQPTLHEMGSLTHAFDSASDEELAVTGTNRLGRQDHRFEAGATDFVDGHGPHAGGQPAIDGALPRDIHAQACRHDIPHDHFVDRCQVRELRPLDGGTHHRGPEGPGG